LNAWKRYISDGARDIMFDECSRRYSIINTLRNLYINSGFMEVSTPTLEFYDVFESQISGIEQERTYKLFDRMGRIMVLRPDMTAPVVRIAATKLKDSIYPVRLCYSGNIFRSNEIWDGKNNEITQSGVEILGVNNSKTDFEIIALSVETLIAAGVHNFEIEIGQAEFFKGIIENLNLSIEETENLRQLVENKNAASLREFLNRRNLNSNNPDVKVLKSMPELFGSIEILDKARKMTSNERALKALDNIEDVYNKIKKIGLCSHVSIDLGMVQHIHYYTGLIFKGYSSKAGCEILSGGRYDKLAEEFGLDIPSVGFAVNIDEVMRVLSRQEGNYSENKDKYLICFNDEFLEAAWLLAKQLRDKGITAELYLPDNEGDLSKYADYKGKTHVIYVIDENTIRLTDRITRNACNFKIEDFINDLEDLNE
jgi:ATP phosphoribosyltransferase regulatory subunit